jgi:hypothetical protein
VKRVQALLQASVFSQSANGYEKQILQTQFG